MWGWRIELTWVNSRVEEPRVSSWLPNGREGHHPWPEALPSPASDQQPARLKRTMALQPIEGFEKWGLLASDYTEEDGQESLPGHG